MVEQVATPCVLGVQAGVAGAGAIETAGAAEAGEAL